MSTKTLEALKATIMDKANEKCLIAEKDFHQGENDCKCGIYDKWYRYNRHDDGTAYDLGWTTQNKTTQNEDVQFIN